jgi:hypothetical protein
MATTMRRKVHAEVGHMSVKLRLSLHVLLGVDHLNFTDASLGQFLLHLQCFFKYKR